MFVSSKKIKFHEGRDFTFTIAFPMLHRRCSNICWMNDWWNQSILALYHVPISWSLIKNNPMKCSIVINPRYFWKYGSLYLSGFLWRCKRKIYQVTVLSVSLRQWELFNASCYLFSMPKKLWDKILVPFYLANKNPMKSVTNLSINFILFLFLWLLHPFSC